MMQGLGLSRAGRCEAKHGGNAGADDGNRSDNKVIQVISFGTVDERF